MKRIEWPLLGPKEIECRIAVCKDGKTQILLYQNARTTMEAFDNMFGTFGWQMEYYSAGEYTLGRLGVYDDEKKEWCWKSDIGEESNISADKGFCSSTLKRVATQWGWARELYTAPKIWINNSDKFMTFNVQTIEYNTDREVSKLVITDKYGKVVFDWSLGQQINTYQPNIQLEQPQPQQNSGFQLQKRDNPTDANGRLSKPLYVDIVKSQTVERLQSIYQLYPELHNNKFFTGTLTKRKNELQQAS